MQKGELSGSPFLFICIMNINEVNRILDLAGQPLISEGLDLMKVDSDKDSNGFYKIHIRNTKNSNIYVYGGISPDLARQLMAMRDSNNSDAMIAVLKKNGIPDPIIVAASGEKKEPEDINHQLKSLYGKMDATEKERKAAKEKKNKEEAEASLEKIKNKDK
jgi:hypothetical protein